MCSDVVYYSTVERWAKQITCRKVRLCDLCDRSRSGRPSSDQHSVIIDRADALIKNRRIAIKELAES